MTHSLRKLIKDRKGNVVAVYAIAVPVILFAVGFAVDFGLAAQLRTRLNAAADAAALAALTPSMMMQTSSVAQTAAVNMFNGQASALTGLTAGSVSVTVAITNPGNNALIRQVQVCYNASEQMMFASALWNATAIPLGNCSTAQAQIPPNIDFYVLLDNSPSMQLPSTSGGVTAMENLTPMQDTGGCAFACHEANTNTNTDIIGNPCLKGTTYTTPTVSACDSNLTSNPSSKCSNKNPYMANAYCSSTQGTQIDNFALAHENSITLRLDVLNQAISTLMQTAQNTTSSTPYTPPPEYRFAINSMDSLWQVAFTKLMSLTKSYVSGWATASANFGVMEYWANNETCTTSACTAGTSYSALADAATNYDNALSNANTQLPNPGNGTNQTGDTPQEVLFIVTDGVEDEAVSGTRVYQVINGSATTTNYCTTIKNRGIKIAIVYTEYLPVTADTWYVDYVEPFQPNIGAALQACASPGLFYDVAIDGDLSQAINSLFLAVVQAANLTQ